MSTLTTGLEQWEYGALDIHNPSTSTLRRYFELIPQLETVPGDILELGVARGRSLLTTGLLLKELSSSKSVVGMDTFTGFPAYSVNDDFSNFDILLSYGEISKEHHNRVRKNELHVLNRGGSTHASQISNSADFSDTSLEYVKKRVDYLGLSPRVKIIRGDFTVNLEGLLGDRRLSLVLLDSDLFESYAKSLPIVWKILNSGGIVYLDEYYSLKFPGPRKAVNEFMRDSVQGKLIRLEDWMDFERWAISKL